MCLEQTTPLQDLDFNKNSEGIDQVHTANRHSLMKLSHYISSCINRLLYIVLQCVVLQCVSLQ